MSRLDNGNDKDSTEDSKDEHIPDPDPPERETANKPDKNEKR